MSWKHARSRYSTRSFRACPTSERYEGWPAFVCGPADSGPTHHSDSIDIQHESLGTGVRVNILHHPHEGGVVLDFFRSGSKSRQVVDLTKTTVIMTGERADIRAGLITPLGDGTFRVDLEPGFYTEIYGPLEWEVYLKLGHHKKDG